MQLATFKMENLLYSDAFYVMLK